MKELTFRADGRTFAIDARSVLSVRSAALVCPVPEAPEGVLGIAAFRGDVVTVVALPGLGRFAAGEGSLVRLAPPREHLALWVPGTPGVTDAADPDAVRLDPSRLG